MEDPLHKPLEVVAHFFRAGLASVTGAAIIAETEIVNSLMIRQSLVGWLAVFVLSAAAYATPIVSGGTHDLLPETSGQVIAITVSGVPGDPPGLGGTGDAFQGVDLFLTINDGTTGPLITAIDLLNGTVFDGNNSGQNDAIAFPARTAFSGTTVDSDVVGPNGVLAYITLDTTNVAMGSYPLHLYLTNPGQPLLLPPWIGVDEEEPVPVLIDGTLNIVPEPGSLVLALLAVVGLCGVAIHRRRRVA